MGTRGIFGFRIDGEDRLTYNHYDSYPEGLGVDVVDFVRSIDNIKEVKEKARALEDISERKPTDEDIKKCEKYTNLNVSEQSEKDWYCLLRETQGDLQAILDVGFYENQNDFIYDSLFCEYGYIVNLDNETLEVYEGCQHSPHNKGRYCDYKPEEDGKVRSEYYACALVGTFPLNEIPKNWAEQCFPKEEE
jgi:hypothetical protein